MSKDNLSGLAAGAAFYALLSIFPTLTALVSVYGLVADPNIAARQVTALVAILPPEADKLVATWLETFVQGPPSRFGIGLLASMLLALWSAWSATGILMTAIQGKPTLPRAEGRVRSGRTSHLSRFQAYCAEVGAAVRAW